jgi:hypothetical protein
MSTTNDQAATTDHTAGGPPAPPTLEQSLQAFVADIDEADRPDVLHQLFYGFYARVAIVDRTTEELARWATEEVPAIEGLPPTLVEALRDNALHVGRELFATRIQAMTAMRTVSKQLAALRPGPDPTMSWTLDRAAAFDRETGTVRAYDLDAPGTHPDLPYDPFAYDPSAEDPTADAS